jgi:hypothetical protein
MNAQRIVILVALLAVLGAAESARGQVDTKAGPGDKAPPAERPRTPLVITPEATPRDVSRPSEADYYRETPRVRHAPAFVGPLSGKTSTGRAGVAGWTSPNTDVGSRGATNPDQAGWFGFGFGLEWGGPRKPADAGER